jgi:ribosome biogenesis protein MAK21
VSKFLNKLNIGTVGGNVHVSPVAKKDKKVLQKEDIGRDVVKLKLVPNRKSNLKPKSGLKPTSSSSKYETENTSPDSPPTPTKTKMLPTTILPASSEWYSLIPTLSSIKVDALPVLKPDHLSNLQTRARTLLTSAQSSSSASANSETTFFQKMITSGTLSDRLSALTLLLQGSPLHNMKALETLKSMGEKASVGSGGREVGLKALRCIVDWWVGGGAPERKLKCVCGWQFIYYKTDINHASERYFRDQSLTHPEVKDDHLLLWYFEDWLKKWFFGVLQVLEVCFHSIISPPIFIVSHYTMPILV